jgi:hypothetical protein
MFAEELKDNYTFDELDAFYEGFYEIAEVWRVEVQQRVLQRESDREDELCKKVSTKKRKSRDIIKFPNQIPNRPRGRSFRIN